MHELSRLNRCRMAALAALVCLVALCAPARGAGHGFIEVQCEPDLKVFLDNKFVGVSGEGGLLLRRVPAGPHVVRVEKEGYQPANSDTFLLEPEQVYVFKAPKLDALLDPQADIDEESARATGSIVIQTIPVECLITLHGIGLTGSDEEIVKTEDRWTANGVRVGRYLATFSARGIEHREVVTVLANRTAHILVDIERGEMTDIGLRNARELQSEGWRERAEAERETARQENMALLRARANERERREDYQRRSLDLLIHQGEKQFEAAQYTRCLYTMLQALYLDPRNEIAQYYYREAHLRQGGEVRAIKLEGEYRQFIYGAEGEFGFELTNDGGRWALRVHSGEKDLEVVDASVHDYTLKFTRRYTLSALQIFSKEKGRLLPRIHASRDDKWAYEDYELTLDGRAAEGRRRWRHGRAKINGMPTDEWFPVTFVKKDSDQPPAGYLGVFHEDVLQVAHLEGEPDERHLRDRKGWPAQYGAVILACYKDSPAEAAGLRQGDFVYKFDGADVLNSADFQNLVATNPFATVVLGIYRDGERKQIRVKLNGA